jgi:hypothetical protein
MDEMWTRVGEQLMARVSGPMHFRLVLQPGMAAVLAVIGGIRDAKTGKPPYFWTLISFPSRREEMRLLKDGWRGVGRVFILALILDAVYQAYELHFFYLGEAIIVAIVLAIVPYLALRGIVTRIARRWVAPPTVPSASPPDSSRH